MLPKLQEAFPDVEFSFMHISPSETKGFYYSDYDLNLEVIEKPSLEKHRKVKILGINFSFKNNNAPESLQNCCLNKSLKDKLANVWYWFGKIGRRFLPKKLKSFFAERKY